MCFVQFDFQMRSAPQQRASFSASELQKVVRDRQRLTFWLGNVLGVTAQCNFSTSELQKVSEASVFWTFWLGNALRAKASYRFVYLLWPHGSAPAALLASLLFHPPDPQIIGKTRRFATFLAFRPTVSSFFWLSRTCIFFFGLYFSSLLFNCPYCRKLDF